MTPKEFKEAAQIVSTVPDAAVDTCLVVGGGPKVWKEYWEITNKLDKYAVMAVNAVGMYTPHLHYWLSLHCDLLAAWHHCRKLNYKGDGPYKRPVTIAHRTDGQYTVPGDIDCTFSVGDPSIKKSAKHGGSLEDSGFMAMCIALGMGFKQVILVGMPADDSGHIFIPNWQYLEHDKAAIRRAWESAIEQYPIIPERVRSMGGLTQELLGQPMGAPWQ